MTSAGLTQTIISIRTEFPPAIGSPSLIAAPTNGSYYDIDYDNITVFNDNDNIVIAGPGESWISVLDLRPVYVDSQGNAYVLTLDQANNLINLWSNIQSGNTIGNYPKGTKIASVSSYYFDQGYNIASFAYDPSTNKLFIAYCELTVDTQEAFIIEYDLNTGERNNLVQINNSYTIYSLTIHNDGLYFIDHWSKNFYVYNISTNTLSEPIPLFQSYNVASPQIPPSIKVINDKIVIAESLSDEYNNWIIGVAVYNPTEHELYKYGFVDVTAFTHYDATYAQYVDVDINTSNGYNVGFIHKEKRDTTCHIEWYIFRLTGSIETAPPQQSPPTEKASYYYLEKIYTWGGDSSYQFLDYHSVNNTFGYATARSARVINGVVDESSYGVSVVSIEYSDSYTPVYGYPVKATMIFDKKNVMYPLGSLLIRMNNQDHILFYGYDINNYYASIAIYNVTSNQLLKFEFPDYGPIINGFAYYEVFNDILTKYWIVLIEYNGTLLNVTYTTTSQGLKLQLERVGDLNNFIGWNSMDTYELVDACSIPYLNLTLITTIEPNNKGNPQLTVYGFNSTYLSIIPLNDTISFTSNWRDLSIRDVICSYNTELISLYDNGTKTSYIYLVNLTTSPKLGISEIYVNTTTTVYKFSQSSSYGILLGASYINSTTLLAQGLILNIDTYNALVREIGQLTSQKSNEEVLLATVLNDTFLVTLGTSYASPSNLTLAGTQLSVETPVPVPEPEILPIVALATTIAVMGILIYIRRNKE